MPWTLYRYILRELLTILLLSTAVMVVVLSFFIAIKPLSDGYLDAGTLVKFVLYTMPTVLGFALPFAGAFAATLVFMRMAGDNEITACAASGISYFRVLVPVAMLGVAMLATLLYLSNFVIPDYYRKATQTAQADALTMIRSQLNRGEPVTMGNFVLHAEAARDVPAQEVEGLGYPVPPVKVMQLDGVVFGQTDDQGKMRWDYTASRAAAMLFRRDRQSWVTIRLRDSVYYDPSRGRMQRAEVDPLDLGPIQPPNPFKDDTRFMSHADLGRLDRRPDLYGPVSEAMRALSVALGAEKLRQALLAGVAADGVDLVGPLSGETFRVSAGQAARDGDRVRLVGLPGRPVRIDHRRHDSPVWSIEAAEAEVRLEAGTFDQEPGVLVQLTEARVYDPGPDRVFTEHPVLDLPRMQWPGPLLPTDDSAGAPPRHEQLRVLSRSEPYAADPSVASQLSRLGLQIRRLALEIIAQRHERAALAVSGFLLLVLGAVLSMRLRNQMTLVVYFAVFVLAIVSLVLVYSGSRAVDHMDMPPAAGLALLWSGNVVLAVVAGWVYCRLAKH